MEKDRGDDRSGTGGEPHREGRLPLGREYLQVGYYMEILFTHAFVMGLCYYLITRCSICTYMKKIGASELMPLFCELG